MNKIETIKQISSKMSIKASGGITVYPHIGRSF